MFEASLPQCLFRGADCLPKLVQHPAWLPVALRTKYTYTRTHTHIHTHRGLASKALYCLDLYFYIFLYLLLPVFLL